MNLSNASSQLNKIGLPKTWQLFILLHALLSLSLFFINNKVLLNAANIVLALLVFHGAISAIKYHKLYSHSWKILTGALVFICISIILRSLTYFGMDTGRIIITIIEELGFVLIGIFSFSFFIKVEKQFNLKGFTLDYSLISVSIILFVFVVSPNLLNRFLFEMDYTQQLPIINLLFTVVVFFMAILNHVLSKKLLLKDFTRFLLVLLLISHFSLDIMKSFKLLEANSTLTQLYWVVYQLAGTFIVFFVFLERFTLDYHHRKTIYLGSRLMWIASAMAILGVPSALIIRDQLGFPPIPSFIIGIVIFFLSTIVILRFQILIKSSEQQKKNLIAIAYTDQLTGLLNYHGYLDKLSRINVNNILVISINVEDFKSINDLYGRKFGDEVLRSLANRLKKTPKTILTARTGADYFHAIFQVHEKNIPELIENVQQYLGIWDRVNNRRIAVPLTYGASYGGTPYIQPEKLARQAEIALKISRDQHTAFTLYSEASINKNNRKLLPRHELREILQKAVDDNYLPIHFQPIYDLKSGSLQSMELLIRVESEKHGLLLPAQFLDQAKSYDLLTSLTAVCINMVAKCFEQLPSNVTININVPPYMLDNPQILNNFISCFEKRKLPMNRFCVEVTEDGDIPTDHLIPSIKLLKQHGFKIAMDDFGTGYSSLSRLSVLPVDVVKIDRSLLLAASAGNKAILESAIALTKRLGAATVVEGVETLEQLLLIKQLGADSVQGFLLSRPVRINKIPFIALNTADIASVS